MNRQSDITDMSKVQIIGTSGTVTTLAAVQLGLAKYDRNVVDGCTISSRDITRVIGDLRRLSVMNWLKPPASANSGRFGLGRLCGFEAIYNRWPVDEFSVADKGLREGLLMRMINKDRRRRHHGADGRSRQSAWSINPAKVGGDGQRRGDRMRERVKTARGRKLSSTLARTAIE